MTSRLVAVAIDSQDPEVLAAFWCEALGYEVLDRWNDDHGTSYLEIGTDDVMLLFQQVADGSCNEDVTFVRGCGQGFRLEHDSDGKDEQDANGSDCDRAGSQVARRR